MTPLMSARKQARLFSDRRAKTSHLANVQTSSSLDVATRLSKKKSIELGRGYYHTSLHHCFQAPTHLLHPSAPQRSLAGPERFLWLLWPMPLNIAWTLGRKQAHMLPCRQQPAAKRGGLGSSTARDRPPLGWDTPPSMHRCLGSDRTQPWSSTHPESQGIALLA